MTTPGRLARLAGNRRSSDRISRRGSRAPGWSVVALLLLAAIPVIAGTGRLVQLFGGPEVLEADIRFDHSPMPLVVHVIASIGYAVLGAFQFSAAIRRRHPAWHRAAGRVLVPLGLAAALSALWLTLLLERKEGTGWLLWSFRLLFATAMAAFLVLGFLAIRRRDVRRHRAAMMRAYALGLGAGTQAFTVGFGEAIFGTGVYRTDLMMGAGWAINLGIAEVLIRRQRRRRAPQQRGSPPIERIRRWHRPGIAAQR